MMFRMMICSVIVLCGIGEVLHAKENELPITVPALIDGKPFGIDGVQVRNQLFIMKQVENITYGVMDPVTHQRVGKYCFEGQMYSLAQLSELENNPDLTDAQRHELARLLIIIKDDFMKIALPFVEQARGVKAITLKFLDEWALKHNRPHSYVLDWSKEEDGKELEAFNKRVLSFGQLYEFCIDLMSFISDLIKSCPRAWQQFLELQQKSHHS